MKELIETVCRRAIKMLIDKTVLNKFCPLYVALTKTDLFTTVKSHTTLTGTEEYVLLNMASDGIY